MKRKIIIIMSVVASICAAIAGLFAWLTYRKRSRYATYDAVRQYDNAFTSILKDKIKNAPTMSVDELSNYYDE
jgi:predicted negative regulator of RcsB-dependent stress response